MNNHPLLETKKKERGTYEMKIQYLAMKMMKPLEAREANWTATIWGQKYRKWNFFLTYNLINMSDHQKNQLERVISQYKMEWPHLFDKDEETLNYKKQETV